MITKEDWLRIKILEYKQNPKEALKNMLATTNNVMEQYKDNPRRVSKGLFNSCVELNKLFLIEVGILDAD